MNARVRTLAEGQIGVVAIAGEIDFSVVADVRKAIEQATASSPACLLIDLSDVSFIASDGLGLLVEAKRKADTDGRKFELIHPQPHILGILRKTQLTRLFHIHESIDDAMKSCS
jgi:anti-sigma B factor antagonist